MLLLGLASLRAFAVSLGRLTRPQITLFLIGMTHLYKYLSIVQSSHRCLPTIFIHFTDALSHSRPKLRRSYHSTHRVTIGFAHSLRLVTHFLDALRDSRNVEADDKKSNKCPYGKKSKSNKNQVDTRHI